MPDRIDARPAIALVGGALLLISLFVTWYTVPAVPPATGEVDFGNAWDVFETLDLVLAAIGVAALYSSWEQLTGRFRFGEGWLLPASLVAMIIVVSQILDPPLIAGSDPSAATGAWLALGGAGSLLVAGVLSVTSVSLAVELDSRSSATTTTRRRAAQDSP
jgi:hypothetical protein